MIKGRPYYIGWFQPLQKKGTHASHLSVVNKEQITTKTPNEFQMAF